MATKGSLIIASVDGNGKVAQKTITDVNMSAPRNHLKDFAAKLCALTDETYVSSTMIKRIEFDGEQPTLPFSACSRVNLRLIPDANNPSTDIQPTTTKPIDDGTGLYPHLDYRIPAQDAYHRVIHDEEAGTYSFTLGLNLCYDLPEELEGRTRCRPGFYCVNGKKGVVAAIDDNYMSTTAGEWMGPNMICKWHITVKEAATANEYALGYLGGTDGTRAVELRVYLDKEATGNG